MKKTHAILFLLLSIHVYADEKFEKILIFAGGALDNPIHLGAYQGLKEKGWDADLVISSCGGSIMNAAIQSNPTVEEQRNFVQSPEFHNLYKSVKVHPDWQGWGMASRATAIAKRDKEDRIPAVFDSPVMQIPQTIHMPTMDIPFKETKPQAIFIASEMHFDASDAGKKRDGRTLLTEVLFTNPKIAEMLKDYKAPNSVPGGRIAPDVKVITDAVLKEAARAGISEPVLLEPKKMNGKTYLAGAIDPYPVALAKFLASKNAQIIIVLPGRHSDREATPLFNTFGFDIRDQWDALKNTKGINVVSLDDASEKLKENLFWPKPKVSLLSAPKIIVNVPEDLEAFKKQVMAQIEYGRQQAFKTLDLMDRDQKAVPHESTKPVLAGDVHFGE